MIIIGCTKSRGLAKSIAKKLKVSYFALDVKHFPDGEFYLRYPFPVKGRHVVLVQTLHEPHLSLLELVFAAHTAKDLGAKKVTLVIPYLAYMRQDKRFRQGECLSSKIVGRLFKVADELITIDPHLHRYKRLNEAFKMKTKKLTANSLLANYIKKHFKKDLIVGPDIESYQWAEGIAKLIGRSAVMLRKRRYTSRKVRVKFKKGVIVRGKNVVLVDDIISTGHTMIEVVKQIKKMKPKAIYCLCVHGVFAENAHEKLKKAGAKKVISTNTIPHKTNRVDVSGLIVNALK